MYLDKDTFLGLEKKLWHKKTASWDREVGTSIGLCFKEKACRERAHRIELGQEQF